jgi:HAE1 family hydrophobic/amphiphilic exporter-1
MSITAFAVRRPVTTIAATLGVILLGAVSVTKLPVSLLPDVELPVLTVRTSYPGAAATEVSRFIAEPIEKSVAATPGIVELRSVSRNNEATTTIHFAWGTDMARTVLNIRERLDNARATLPAGAGRPTLLTSDPGERPIAVLAITSKGTLADLAHLAEDVHSRRLEQLEGVASVAVVGSPLDEIEVRVDPERLRALGLSAQQIGNAITAANAQGGNGTIRRGQFRYSVRALTELTSPEQLLDTPISSANGLIRLRDVAEVAVTTAPPLTVTRLGGKPAIGLVVYKDAGANTVAVTDRMTAAVDQLRKDYPDVEMTIVAAQAQFVTDALSNLWQEVWLGGLLSILVPLLFLRDVRASVAIALMLPLSVLVALVLLRGLDVTVNILSLGGLALGCGLLIDNAIVVAEAASARRHETGESREEATINATADVSGPLIAGTLTTLLVFGPIIFVKGLAAALFRDLSWSVVMSVAGSLVLALTLMPVLIVGRRGRHPEAKPKGKVADGKPDSFVALRMTTRGLVEWSDRFGERCAHIYEAGMMWALDHRAIVLVATAASVILLIPVVLVTPREILPRVDEGTVIGTLKLQEGTALEETIRQVSRIEGVAKNFGSTRTYSRVGLATDEEVLGGSDPGSSASAQVIIPAPDGKTAVQVAEEIRRQLPDLAGAGYLSLDVAGESEFGALTGREGRLVKVEVEAATYAESQRVADIVRERMAKLATLSDVRNAFATTQPIVEIESERDRIAEHGLTPAGVVAAMSGALGGLNAGDLRQTDRRTPITVRYRGSANEDLDAALATAVNGIPVSQLVSAKEARAPIEVVRVHQRPVTIIEGSIERGGTAKAVRDVQAILNTVNQPGVTFQITGADIEQRRTTDQLTFVAILSAALMFLVLAGEFASFVLPVVVMLTVPLAAVGSLYFMFFTGQSINAVSLIGIVVMIGMADNEAVVKIDAIRRFREMGHSVRESVLLGGRQRLRAIVMTSLTTVTGVVPLMFGIGGGGALYRPLAAAVIGGAISSILVTFFVLPVAYTMLEERHERAAVPAGAPGSLSLAAAELPQPQERETIA